MVRDRQEPAGTVGAVKKVRLLTVAAVVLLVAAACGNSGAPTSWDDNPADYKGEADVGQPERNFRDGCEEAGFEELDAQVGQNLADVCECSFDQIREALTFEEFKGLDDDLRSDINADLTEEVRLIMRQCILEESGL